MLVFACFSECGFWFLRSTLSVVNIYSVGCRYSLCRLYGLLCRLCTLLCRLCTLLCRLYALLCWLYALLCRLTYYSVGCNIYSVICTHYSVGCQYFLCRLYAILCWLCILLCVNFQARGNLLAELAIVIGVWSECDHLTAWRLHQHWVLFHNLG